jgi:VanZ family protein
MISILIFILSSIPEDKLSDPKILGIDKLEHLGIYLLYGISLVLAFSITKSNRIFERVFVLSIWTGLAFGALDEVHQLFVTGRSCDIFDFTADALGIFLGAWIALKLRKPFLRFKNET